MILKSENETASAGGGLARAARPGDVISGIAAAEALDGVSVLHAGTALDASGALVSHGGRVLSVLGRGDDVAQARERAYAGVDRIRLRGAVVRRDIAAGR